MTTTATLILPFNAARHSYPVQQYGLVDQSLADDSSRASDTIARLGGDEFVVLLPQTATDGALHVAGKLLAALDVPFHLAGENLTISLSVGIATFPFNGEADAGQAA